MPGFPQLARYAGERRGRWLIGGLVAALYFLQILDEWQRDELVNLLWFCAVAQVMILCGYAFRSKSAMGVGFIWAVFGFPLWFYEVLTAGGFPLIAYLTHFGSVIFGGIGVLAYGFCKGLWWKVPVLFSPVFMLSRAYGPPELNINLSHAIRMPSIVEGWEPPYALYIGVFVIAGVVFSWLVEVLGERVRGILLGEDAKPGLEPVTQSDGFGS